MRVLGLILVLASSALAADPPAFEAKLGMVVAAEPLAAEAGVEMLRLGGNAVDAAVATGFALAVTYPVAGNLGGGGFMIATLPTDSGVRTIALDFRETAPAKAHADLYTEAESNGSTRASTLGHLAAGVPGSVAGMLHALEKWGTLDRSVVIGPAIRLARDGFPMTRRQHRFLSSESIAKNMKRFAGTRAIFYPDNSAPAEGALFRQPDLATTLERIADNGPDGFYSGATAELICAEMERGGGIITREDLAAYRPIERTPVDFGFRDLRIVTMPPPSSGGICLQQMLGMLGAHSLVEAGHNSSASIHLLAEAMRRSFADRNQFLGDPDHHELPIVRLTSAEHIRKHGASIDPSKATPSSTILAGGDPPREKDQTTHYSVVDRHGGAVAVTTTLNGAFGSKVAVEGAGFLLNNEMDDFATRPGKPNLYGLVQGKVNAVGPGRRPLSSMTPTIVLDPKGQVRHVLGTPGGPTIITNVLQVFLNLEVFGLAPQAAINAPKIHHQCLPDRLDIEPGIPRDVWIGLGNRGHVLRERRSIGDFQLITRDPKNGLLRGASDPRGEGAARGY